VRNRRLLAFEESEGHLFGGVTMRVDIDGGHYTIIWEEECGRLRALRYGKEWQDLTGDNLSYLMAVEIEELRAKVMVLEAEVTAANDYLASVANWTTEAERSEQNARR
jgi:hypothetical protein